jgi:hypothetical protein
VLVVGFELNPLATGPVIRTHGFEYTPRTDAA